MKERRAKVGESVSIAFQDNSLLPMLFGDEDIHLTKLEKKFNVQATTRGNMLSIAGEKNDVDKINVF